MPNIKYIIQLSADGGPVVAIETDDPAATKRAVKWAQAALSYCLAQAGSLAETDGEELETDEGSEQAPVCRTHGTVMVRQHGRRGDFWSCHQRNSDGSWCSYRPPK